MKKSNLWHLNWGIFESKGVKIRERFEKLGLSEEEVEEILGPMKKKKEGYSDNE